MVNLFNRESLKGGISEMVSKREESPKWSQDLEFSGGIELSLVISITSNTPVRPWPAHRLVPPRRLCCAQTTVRGMAREALGKRVSGRILFAIRKG